METPEKTPEVEPQEQPQVVPQVEEPGEETPQKEPEKEGVYDPRSPSAIYARKQYQRAKRAEEQLQAERLEKIRLEERLRALEEQKKEKVEEQVFTAEQIEQAIETKAITRAQGMQLLARQEAKRLREEEQEKRQQNEPIERAKVEINEYMELIPELADKNSKEFTRAKIEYAKLIQLGHPADQRTERVALQLAHGSIEAIKKKAELKAAPPPPPVMPVDMGGAGNHQSNGKLDINKAPAHLIAYWNRTHTSQADREDEFRRWQKRQPQK